MKIFLVGYMGCGKSTIGKRLAELLKISFCDLDEEIEKRENRSISRIFESEGEAGFRGIEKKHLNLLTVELPQLVVATGGGTPCFYDNMKFMKENGLVIYLKMDWRSLAFRLKNSDEQRPLIAGKTESQLYRFIQKQLEERIHYYEESHIEVNALGFGEKKLENLVSIIADYSK